MRRTKIICTIGPASDRPEILRKLMEAGMNVARLNFSHGTHGEHSSRIDSIRSIAQEMGLNIGIMLDTKGPEIRTGLLKDGVAFLEAGKKVTLFAGDFEGSKECVPVTHDFSGDVQPGATVLVDDGLLELRVDQIRGSEIICDVIEGGLLKNRKGINLPKSSVSLPGVTQKDKEDIRFGIEKKVDFIAASFMRKASDVLEIRQMLEEAKARISIIAKIENEEGVSNAGEILEVADGLMVARGDLGVEIPPEDVPLVQKRLIRLCNAAGKPVITATQMLDSMQQNARPTRAEASDVANAIFDGSDAIMLSGETAAGKYPVESVQTMARIARRVERSPVYLQRPEQVLRRRCSIPDAVGHVVAQTAKNLEAAAILTPTESGYTARAVSKYRPDCPIIAVTPHADVMNQLSLVWGVFPVRYDGADSTDEVMESAITAAVKKKLVKYGDLIVITAGVPVREPGTTNMLKVHVIGRVVARGRGVGSASASGRVLIIGSEGWEQKINAETILVGKCTDQSIEELLQRCAGVVTEETEMTCPGAIAGLHQGKPVILGVEGATELLSNGDEITIDPNQGQIYHGFAKVF